MDRPTDRGCVISEGADPPGPPPEPPFAYEDIISVIVGAL